MRRPTSCGPRTPYSCSWSNRRRPRPRRRGLPVTVVHCAATSAETWGRSRRGGSHRGVSRGSLTGLKLSRPISAFTIGAFLVDWVDDRKSPGGVATLASRLVLTCGFRYRVNGRSIGRRGPLAGPYGAAGSGVVVEDHRGEEVDGLPVLVQGDRDGFGASTGAAAAVDARDLAVAVYCPRIDCSARSRWRWPIRFHVHSTGWPSPRCPCHPRPFCAPRQAGHSEA